MMSQYNYPYTPINNKSYPTHVILSRLSHYSMINHNKIWDRAGIELSIPGFAVRLASLARHITDCATWHGKMSDIEIVQISIFYGTKH